MLGLQPIHASDAGHYQLIDIRPNLERYSGMGFVAGSLSLPQSNELRSHADTIRRMAGTKLPVLVCLTGHRAHGLTLALAQSMATPLRFVEGGLFAWNAEGLPLAGLRLAEEIHTPLAAAEFQAVLRGQLEILLAGVSTGASDPAGLVIQRCSLALGCPMERCRPDQLRTLLDLLAVMLLDFGISRGQVSALLDHLLARLPSAWPDTAAAV